MTSIATSVAIPLAQYGSPDFISFDDIDGDDVAIAFGDWRAQSSPLVRLHSECLTGDVFGSQRCDCQAQLHAALSLIAEKGGVLLYLRQEGRGIGLKAKLAAYEAQIQKGLDTYEANHHVGHGDDERDYAQAASMLKAMNVHNVQLISNNPTKAKGLASHGVTVSAMIATGCFETQDNHAYLRVKAAKGGHQF